MSGVFTGVLALNVVWFFMGFWYFTVKSVAAARSAQSRKVRASLRYSARCRHRIAFWGR